MKKRRRAAPAEAEEEPDEPDLVNDAMFQHAVALCGVNSYRELRKSHPRLMELLPDYKKIWQAKRQQVVDDLIKSLDVHKLGLELDPTTMMCKAVEVFGRMEKHLWNKWPLESSSLMQGNVGVFGKGQENEKMKRLEEAAGGDSLWALISMSSPKGTERV